MNCTILIYQFPARYLYFIHHKRRIDFCDFSWKVLDSQANKWWPTDILSVGWLWSLLFINKQAFTTVSHFASFWQFQAFTTVSHFASFWQFQAFTTVSHFASFWQFQSLSGETWSRAAWNFFEIYFQTFLSNKRKQLLIPGWTTFLLSEIITISILHYFVWTFWQHNLLLTEVKFDLKICEE